jgi:hypothetical protein
VRHDVTLGFPVCYGSPSDVFAASSSFVHLVYIVQYALKGKRNQRQWWQTQLYASREVDGQWFKCVGRLEFAVDQRVI